MLQKGDVVDFEIIDDSGVLGLVDVSAYEGFVDEEWSYEQLFDHFNTQMELHRILVWKCGDGGDEYRIRVRGGFTSVKGWRHIFGSIIPTCGDLHLTSYSALTMAAQFNDVTLPEDHERNLKVTLKKAPHKIRIVQNYNPDAVDLDSFSEPHFIIEIEEDEAEAGLK